MSVKKKDLHDSQFFPQNYLNYFKWISFKLQIWRTQFQEITFHDLRMSEYRSSRPDVFCKIGVLRNFTKFTGKPVYQSLFFGLQLKKETLVLVFSCEFCEISKNTFFIEHLQWLLLANLCTIQKKETNHKTKVKTTNIVINYVYGQV